MRDEGVSALEKFIPIHAALLAHERAHHDAITHPLYQRFSNRAPINIGTVRAGNWPSSVPESIMVEGRAGLVPGEDLEQTRLALVDVIEEVAVSDPWLREHPPRLEWFSGQFAPAQVDIAHPLVGTLSAAHKYVTGKAANLDASTYGADMRHFVNAGKIPCVMYGAGDVRLAHRPDESVPIADVVTATKTLALTMMSWCGVHNIG
jgi:acetylornithine deacetylase